MYKITSILIAEDDEDDRLLLQDAFNENNVSSDKLLFAANGEELMDLLEVSEVKPSMIFIDLNMPKKDGRQALKEIRQKEGFRHVPIIIFSTSNSLEDIRTSYENGANTYFTKPTRYRDLVETLADIKAYWWERASLPPY